MKILIVSAPFPLGREEIVYTFVYEESLGLQKRGVEIHVARGPPTILDNKRDLVVEGMHIHNFSRKIDFHVVPTIIEGARQLHVSSFFHPRKNLATLPYSWFISKVARKYDVDLVHAHFALPEGFASILMKSALKKPVVLTVHGYDILVERSVNYGVRLKKFCDNMVRKAIAEADLVFAASRYVCKEALNAGCPKERLVYLPNGVDLKRFNLTINNSMIRKIFGIADRPVVFTVRPHEKVKGLDYLLEAIPLILDEVPETIFIIGGDGPLRVYHESLAKRLRVSEHVLFVGTIPHNLLPYYYATCDIFVIPSVMEAFGMVTIEAMACGKPVVGTGVGGIPDTIEDGVNGFLVRPRNPREIADKVVMLLQNRELRIEMGMKGVQIAETKFNLEKRLDRIVEFYSQLIH